MGRQLTIMSAGYARRSANFLNNMRRWHGLQVQVGILTKATGQTTHHILDCLEMFFMSAKMMKLILVLAFRCQAASVMLAVIHGVMMIDEGKCHV